jgi:hypothetical protein
MPVTQGASHTLQPHRATHLHHGMTYSETEVPRGMEMPSCILGIEIPLLLACSIYLPHFRALVSSVEIPFPDRKRDIFTLTATLTQHKKNVQEHKFSPCL